MKKMKYNIQLMLNQQIQMNEDQKTMREGFEVLKQEINETIDFAASKKRKFF